MIQRRSSPRRISQKKLKALGGLYPSSTAKRSSKQIKKVNRKRRQSEFQRCYHSKERVLFVKGRGCLYCRMTFGQPVYPNVHNAHTESGGSGRKAGYETIIPLCATHHSAYDEHRPPLASDFIRGQLKADAAEVQRAWHSHISEKEQ